MKKQGLRATINAANRAVAKLHGTARGLFGDAVTLKVVGRIELKAENKAKSPRQKKEINWKAAYESRRRIAEMRQKMFERHILNRLLAGEWVPTRILARLSNFDLLKSLRRNHFKGENPNWAASLKWTIGECFRSAKEFVAELNDRVTLVIG